MAVNFYIDNRTDKNGDAPIRVSVSIKGARFITSTGYKIPPAKWDADRQQARRGCSNSNGVTYSTINTQLLKISEHFAAYENECIIKGTAIDKTELHREFVRNFTPSKTPPAERNKSFFDIWDEFTNERGEQNQWTNGTYYKFSALKNHLKQWKPSPNFSDFDESGLVSLMTYFRENVGMKNSTIGKQFGFLKWFLRWAVSKGYNKEKAFLSCTPKLKTAPQKVVFLDWDELMRLYNFTVPANGDIVTLHTPEGKEYQKTVHDAAALTKTRDIFCFCCFTSLRYSDVANLKKSNINGDHISITTIKTADAITIELNKYSISILQKYQGVSFPDGRALPQISNQRMNEYIKFLCELCEINQPTTKTYYRGNQRIDEVSPKYALIGTHTARRTFICNALMLGISPQIVMKWTGHSDYKSMKPYIDVTDEAKAKAMDVFNNL